MVESDQPVQTPNKKKARPSGPARQGEEAVVDEETRASSDNIEYDANGNAWLIQKERGRCHYCVSHDEICRTQINGSLVPGGRTIGSILCLACRKNRRTAHRCDVDLRPASTVIDLKKELKRRQKFDRRASTLRRQQASATPPPPAEEKKPASGSSGVQQTSEVLIDSAKTSSTIRYAIENLEDVIAAIEGGTEAPTLLPFLRRTRTHLSSLI